MRMRMKRITAFASLGMLVVSLVACSPPADQSADEIRILFSAPLTGDSAESGRAMLNGAELAAATINEAGGVTGPDGTVREIVVEGVDDEMTSQGANAIAGRFAADSKYFALAGFMDTGLAQAAAVVAQRSGLSILSAFGCGEALVDSSDNAFVLCAEPSASARVATSFVADQIPDARFATVSIDVPQLEGYYAGVETIADERGLEWTAREMYPPTATDYSTVVTNALAGNPDAVISGSLQASAAQVLLQVRRSDPDLLFVDMLGEGWGTTFLETAGEAAVGAIGQDLGYGTEAEGDNAASYGRYLEQYGTPMSAAAQHGYDSILAVAAAAEKTGDRSDFAEAMKGIDVDGLTGPISFENGMRADERIITMSEITGTELGDRTVRAHYLVRSDGTVEETGR